MKNKGQAFETAAFNLDLHTKMHYDIVAVARTLLSSFWYMLNRSEPYKELGGNYFNQRRKDVKVNILTKQLEKLGYAVQLEPVKLQLVPA